VEEGERTTSPPVCLPCAVIAVQSCPHLRAGYVAAWVEHTPVWGVAGIRYERRTLTPLAGDSLDLAEYGTTDTAWIVAARTVMALYGVTPVNLEDEAARMDPAELAAGIARVTGDSPAGPVGAAR
jgi:hypothetical protein